jgi:hypothetical protein
VGALPRLFNPRSRDAHGTLGQSVIKILLPDLPIPQHMKSLATLLAFLCLLTCPSRAGEESDRFIGPPAPAQQATRSFRPPKFVNYREPGREYVERAAGGWKVWVERELAEGYPDLADKALRRLDAKLGELIRLLPASSHARLQQLPIFLMLGEEAKAGGRDNGAEYFQHDAPNFFEQLDPRWGSSLVIYSARNYVWLTDDWALRLLIHEFAHAWHLEQWPEKQPDIMAAWKNAVAQKLYEGVKDVQATRLVQAYAATNQLEYFAELSCAYFFRGEYEPFDREALREHDPAGFAMIEKMWGVHGPAPAATR